MATRPDEMRGDLKLIYEAIHHACEMSQVSSRITVKGFAESGVIVAYRAKSRFFYAVESRICASAYGSEQFMAQRRRSPAEFVDEIIRLCDIKQGDE